MDMFKVHYNSMDIFIKRFMKKRTQIPSFYGGLKLLK